MVGRSTQFHLTPFSQKEISQIENALETRQHLESRLIYGSYPEVVMLESFERKTDYLRDIVGAYLLKDILAIDGLKNSSLTEYPDEPAIFDSEETPENDAICRF